ncbi:hypothetical protein JK358_35830 [Nocardia sp. 2]|uniref:Zinc ribbon domain-containing protein n=1 Tax=Nocardia acididurans TaxID=2802282 RepID=A0ABS1MGJ6_9NOCA|nr:hypothetical protein [Nocardia acididurans]MBL1079786.1 hypothetical protein [Nocardia acididurans]
MESICRFCRHVIGHAATACEHCGAPLTQHTTSHEPDPPTAPTPSTATTVGSGLLALLTARARPRWRAVVVTILTAAALGWVALRSLAGCELMFTTPGVSPIVAALPKQLRSAATCTPVDAGVQRCVLTPEDALLEGDLTGGKPLTFDARLVAPAPLADTLARWRVNGAVRLDGEGTFVATGPTTSVWYAQSRSGLRIDTSPFVSADAGWTFLGRAGLLP